MTESYRDKQILVLDNDIANKRITSDVFSPLGIRLLVAADTDQTLKLLSSGKIDALVTDIQMSSVDFLSTVRKRFPDLAIIVLVGFNDGHLVNETELGNLATTILSQPFKQEDIVVAVRNVFQSNIISSATEALNKDGESNRARVLLAEDDESQRTLLSMHLKKQGYQATCAADGALTLEAVESNDFDILVTDIMMPRIDGIELTQKVKKLKPKLPIIALSAAGDVDTSLNALRAGAYCYVVKPVNIQELSLFMDRAMLANQLEKELRQQNALLVERTEELRKSLAELREQSDLQATSRLASVKKLSASVAHELKNPLNSISASVFYVRSKIPEETLAAQPKITKHCDTIEAQIQRSKNIIESIMDFAKSDLAEMVEMIEMIEIQINDLLAESVRQALSAAEEVEVRFELDRDLPSVMACDSKLKLVFGNLCINAANAMKNKGTLTIKTEVDDPANIKITFTDSGPGVPPSIMNQIFDPFFTTAQTQGGTGLGLAICQETIKQHGGTIAVSNVPGGGASFTVTLPQIKSTIKNPKSKQVGLLQS